MTVEDAIAANIRAWCARRGIRQPQLAAEMQELGFTSWVSSTASLVMRGKRRVTGGELFALAQILDCAPASLFDLSHLYAVEFPNGKPVTR